MKKLLVALSAAAACALLAIGGYAYYSTPVNYVSFDINPSVELGLNTFGTVVSAESCNEDGALLLQNRTFTRLSLEDALGGLVEEAGKQGFLAQDGSSVIAVTAESERTETAARLQADCENDVRLALQTQNRNAVVYTDCSDLQLRTRAQAAGVSPGKYKLIAALQALEPDVSVEDYRDAKNTDIIAKAGALLEKSGAGQDDAYARTYPLMGAAAPPVRAAKAQNRNVAALQTREQDQTQDQTQTQEQDQTQAQDQTQQQTQEQTQTQTQEQTQTQQQTQDQAQTQADDGSGTQTQAGDGSAQQEQSQNAGSSGTQQDQEQNAGTQTQNGGDSGSGGSGTQSGSDGKQG